MKRTRNAPSAGIRPVDVRRLAEIHGGDGLGITVNVPPPTPSIMQFQHNETLVAL